jgi:hypothetical protein
MKLVSKNRKKEVKEQLVIENQELINELIVSINNWFVEANLDASAYNLKKWAEEELLLALTAVDSFLPIQSVIGMMYKIISPTELWADRAIAAQILYYYFLTGTKLFELEVTAKGNYRLKSHIYNKELENKYYNDVLDTPTQEINNFGSYHIKMPNKKSIAHNAIQILNSQEWKLFSHPDDIEPTIDNSSYENLQKSLELLRKYLFRRSFNSKFNSIKNKGFYTKWGFDSRGRMYPGGYYINLQGDELEKASIVLPKKEQLTEEGWRNLKCQIAKSYGIDKTNDDEKLKWFNKNEWRLDKLKSPKEPYMFKYHLFQYNRAKMNGGYADGLMELDESQSQMQMSAILLRNKEIGKSCNLVPTYDKKGNIVYVDLYNKVAEYIMQLLKVDFFKRDHFKYPVMITGYGSGKKRLIRQFQDDMEELFKEGLLKENQLDAVADLFYVVLDIVLPGYLKTMKAINNMWNGTFTYKNINGFHMKVQEEKADYIELDKTHRMLIRGIDPEADFSLLPFVNLVHNTDAVVAQRMVIRAKYSDIQLYPIHDAFRFGYNYGSQIKTMYKEVMKEVMAKDTLSNYIKAMTGKKLEVSGNLKPEDINKAEYAID